MEINNDLTTNNFYFGSNNAALHELLKDASNQNSNANYLMIIFFGVALLIFSILAVKECLNYFKISGE